MDAKYHQEWLEHDGKECVVDGLKCIVRVRTYPAVFPREHTAIMVSAEPKNKRSKKYRKIRRELGDDWSTDLLSSFETGCDVLEQIQRTPTTSV